MTAFAVFLLSLFVEIRRKAISGVGCRSPPANLDFSKKFRLEETEVFDNTNPYTIRIEETDGRKRYFIAFFLNPYAIPARVVCPFFKIHPNGLPIEDGSPLLAVEHIFPALAISLALAAASFWICSKLLGSGGKSNG